MHRIRSELCVPIIVNDEAIGVLDLCHTQPDQFSQRDQRLLETLAQHVASAVVRVKQLSEQRTYEKRLELLHTHVFDLSDSSTLEEISAKTQDTIVRLFDPQRTVFALVDDGVLKPVTVYGPNAPVGMPLDGPGITIRAIRTGVTQRVNDTRLDNDYVSGVQSGDPESLSEMDVPLIIDGEIDGLIGVESTFVDAFTLQDQKLVEILAKHVASAMSRLRQVETLEKLVERRSQELVEAEKMSTAGKIAAMVGHDLRGPLQTIKNSLYLMKRNPDKGADLRETIDEAVDYAASMLEELRLKVGDAPLQLQKVNLRALIHRAVDEASLPDSVKTELHVNDGLDSVSMDPLKIRRVLDNLLRNALEAMPDGGTLGVSAVCDGDVVFIRVRDTGSGIPEELMPELFKAFVTTKPKGMGLGLAYCKRAVEAHRGTISVESKTGEGSTFTIRLSIEPK